MTTNPIRTKGDTQEAIELFRQKIEQRKLCEKNAFKICMKLIDDETVDEKYLKDSAQFLNQERYCGVNEDRSLKNICGYPLCSKTLPKNISNNPYFISVKENKVYDVTERKRFCSNFCYKASKYFEKQIPTSPVWAREHEQIPDIQILSKSDLNTVSHICSNQYGQEIIANEISEASKFILENNVNQLTKNVHNLKVSSSSSPEEDDDDDDDDNELATARSDYYKIHPKQPINIQLTSHYKDLVSRKLPIHLEDKTVNFVINCVHEWITEKTVDLIQKNISISKPIEQNEQYQKLCAKLDHEERAENGLSSSSVTNGKLPPIEELKKNNGYELKVKEFLFGKQSEQQQQQQVIKLRTEKLNSSIDLPPIDPYSQHTIRLSIVNEKISTCLQHMSMDSRNERIQKIHLALPELLLTMSFDNENIALKPNEWTIVTLIILH
ncbi:unnamed protein product, partial [Didymodactylos carnosus]